MLPGEAVRLCPFSGRMYWLHMEKHPDLPTRFHAAFEDGSLPNDDELLVIPVLIVVVKPRLSSDFDYHVESSKTSYIGSS